MLRSQLSVLSTWFPLVPWCKTSAAAVVVVVGDDDGDDRDGVAEVVVAHKVTGTWDCDAGEVVPSACCLLT